MTLTEREQAWLLAAAELRPAYEDADVKLPYVKLGGDNPDYIWQDGHVYGAPVATGTMASAQHVANLLRDRPFDTLWLKAVVPPS